MKLFMPFIFLIALSLSFFACEGNPCGNSKEDFLKNIDAFVLEIKEKKLPYESSEWEYYEAKFEKFTKECYPKYEKDLSLLEKKEVYIQGMTYYGARYGEKINEQLDMASSGVREFSKLMKGIDFNSVKDELNQQFKDLGIDLSKIDMNALKEGLKGLINNIKELTN